MDLRQDIIVRQVSNIENVYDDCDDDVLVMKWALLKRCHQRTCTVKTRKM